MSANVHAARPDGNTRAVHRRLAHPTRPTDAINSEEDIMASPRRQWLRSAPCAGAAALALAGLAACSAGTSPASAPLGGASSARTSPASTPPGGAASPAASAGTSGASGWRSHPCVLLTGAEASAALGQRVRALENTSGGLCQYISTGLSAGTAFIQTWAGDWRSCKQTVSLGSKRPVPVSGVGDEALWDAKFGNLCVRSGSIGLLVIIGGSKISQLSDHGLAQAESLARLILPRL